MCRSLSAILIPFLLFTSTVANAGEHSFLSSVYQLLLLNDKLTLTVKKTGDGSGVVTSDTQGIDCGTVCSEKFKLPTDVLLTASPSPGNAFTGWSGGGCSGTELTCTVSVESVTTTVTAIFSPSIEFNTPVNDTILTTRDDWYQFDAIASGPLTVQFDLLYYSTTTDDWRIQLYDNSSPNPQLLREVTVNIGDSFNVDIPVTGIYYFVVSKKTDDHSATDYSLTIIPGNSEPAETEFTNDRKDGADSLDYNVSMHGNLISIDDEDWYTIDTTAGSSLIASIAFSATGTTKDWIVTVFDNAGVQLLRAPVMDKDGTQYYVHLPAGGTYYFVVSNLKTASADFNGRQYSLTVNKDPIASLVAEEEDNNTDATPTVVSNFTIGGDALTGQSALSSGEPRDLPDDTDWFSFDASAGDLTIQLSSLDTVPGLWNVGIKGATGLDLGETKMTSATGATIPNQMTVTILLPGTYYLSVKPVAPAAISEASQYKIAVIL